MSNLAVIIEQSGIEKSKQTRIAETLGAFFDKAQEWETAIQSIEITEPTQIEEMEFAKSLRLEMKRTRLQGEKLITQQRADIKLRMADDVLEDKLWLRVGQMMEAQYANLEGKAQEKERFAEIWEANRILKLRETRNGQIQSEPTLLEFIPSSIDLGLISEDDYGKLLSGAKMQRDAKIAAEQKAESERLALLKKQEDERIELEKKREAERIAMEQENERLRLEGIEKDKVLKAEQERAKAEKDRQDAIIEKERKEAAEQAEKLRIENEKQLEIERENSRIALEKQQQEQIQEAQRKMQEREEALRLKAEEVKLIGITYESGIELEFEEEMDSFCISKIGESIKNGKSNTVSFDCRDHWNDGTNAVSLILNIGHAQKIINHLGKEFNLEVQHG